MRIIEPSYKINSPIDAEWMLNHVEQAARIAYQSEPKVVEGKLPHEVRNDFLRRTIKRGHLSVFEHCSISVLFRVDRGVTHEMVRHRIVAVTQESTRWCNYGLERFGRHIAFIKPLFLPSLVCGEYDSYEHYQGVTNHIIDPGEDAWLQGRFADEKEYFFDLEVLHWEPGEARNCLPNCLASQIEITANIREWRHIFSLRCANDAHKQMRQVMQPCHAELKSLLPVFFE